MHRTKRLALHREALSALAPAELDRIVGATHLPTDCTCVTEGCLTHGYSCEACAIPSLPVNDCIGPTGPIRCLPIQTS